MEIVINYWAVLGAAVSYMVIGGIWYGPLFGSLWKKLIGLTDEDMKMMPMGPWQAMGVGLIASLVMAYVLKHMLVFAAAYYQDMSLVSGFMGGFWIWLGFFAPVALGSVLWEGKPWKLWFLNGSFYLISLVVMAGILTAWM